MGADGIGVITAITLSGSGITPVQEGTSSDNQYIVNLDQGETVQLSCAFEDLQGNPVVYNGPVVYKTLNSYNVAVGPDGVVTAINQGVGIIQVSVPAFTADLTSTVYALLTVGVSNQHTSDSPLTSVDFSLVSDSPLTDNPNFSSVGVFSGDVDGGTGFTGQVIDGVATVTADGGYTLFNYWNTNLGSRQYIDVKVHTLPTASDGYLKIGLVGLGLGGNLFNMVEYNPSKYNNSDWNFNLEGTGGMGSLDTAQAGDELRIDLVHRDDRTMTAVVTLNGDVVSTQNFLDDQQREQTFYGFMAIFDGDGAGAVDTFEVGVSPNF